MISDEPMDTESEAEEIENQPLQQSKKKLSLLNLAARSATSVAISIYDKDGLNAMQIYLSALPEELIYQIYSMMVESFNRGDIVFYSLFNLYKGSKATTLEEKVEEVDNFLHSFSRKIKTLLAIYSVKEIKQTIDNKYKSVDKNQFENFMQLLMESKDIEWLSKFWMGLNLMRKSHKLIEEMDDLTAYKLYKYLDEMCIQEMKKIEISDPLHVQIYAKMLIEILINVYEQNIDYEDFLSDVSNDVANVINHIDNLDVKERLEIVRQILIRDINIAISFDGLFEFLFPTNSGGVEGYKKIKKEIIKMLSEYYPETIKNIYINFPEQFNENIIVKILEKFSYEFEPPMLPNDTQEMAKYINKSIKKFGSNFTAYMLKNYFLRFLNRWKSFAPKEQLLLTLQKLLNISSSESSSLSRAINNSAILSINALKNNLKGDESDLSKSFELQLTLFKIYALFDDLIR